MNIDETRKNLPIYAIRNKLVGEIQRNPVLILLGETGCGKTTQIPQFIYESQSTMKGQIACTQPRRVAAITVAMRVCEEMKCDIGTLTGYCVRFEDCTSQDTKIKYMTDGMLVRESILDPLLLRYTVIILDEVHERTLHTDILLAIIKTAQRERLKQSLKHLKIILMSATMDVDHFSKYFNNAPVFYLEGRQHPIEILHAANEQTDYLFSSLTTVFQIHRTAPITDDILLFLTGQEEIDSTVKTILELNKTLNLKQNLPMICLPFYASLPSNKQLKVFEEVPSTHRKVIVSTNIAETSITIKRIKYVVDSGMIKSKLFMSNTNMELLKIQKISKSQAWQRSGRAGREQSGICYRLYTENDYEKMVLNTIPEILRTNLSSVILQLLAIGIKNIFKFDFIDKPNYDNIKSALNELELLSAVKKDDNQNADELEQNYSLTKVGLLMAKFPLDPKHSKCIIEAQQYSCVEDLIKIISLLNVENIFLNNTLKQDKIKQIRDKFNSSHGDHITLLNIYKAFIGCKMNKDWCHENFLDYKNLKLATEIRKQLREICAHENIKLNSALNDTVSIRKALIHGLFMNCAEYYKENEFKTLNYRQTVQIHPSSVLFTSKPAFLLYNDLVQTNKTYMRIVSVINSDWLLELNTNYFRSKLLKRSFNEMNS